MCLFTNNCTPPPQLFALSPPSRLHPTPPHIPIPSPMTPTKIAPAGNKPESRCQYARVRWQYARVRWQYARVRWQYAHTRSRHARVHSHLVSDHPHLTRAPSHPARAHSKVGFVARNSDCQARNNNCKPRNHYFPPRNQNKHHLHPCRKGLSLCCMGGDGDEGNGCGTDLFIGNAIASSKVVSLPL